MTSKEIITLLSQTYHKRTKWNTYKIIICYDSYNFRIIWRSTRNGSFFFFFLKLNKIKLKMALVFFSNFFDKIYSIKQLVLFLPSTCFSFPHDYQKKQKERIIKSNRGKKFLYSIKRMYNNNVILSWGWNGSDTPWKTKLDIIFFISLFLKSCVVSCGYILLCIATTSCLVDKENAWRNKRSSLSFF